jgi:hypothetical protein
MRRETRQEREAWTALIEGRAPVENKFNNDRTREFAGRQR